MISDQAFGLREKRWLKESEAQPQELLIASPISIHRTGSFCFLVPSDLSELIGLYQEIKSVLVENENASIVLIGLEDESFKNALGLRKTLKQRMGCNVQVQREVL